MGYRSAKVRLSGLGLIQISTKQKHPNAPNISQHPYIKSQRIYLPEVSLFLTQATPKQSFRRRSLGYVLFRFPSHQALQQVLQSP